MSKTYDDIISFRSLYRAHRKTRLNKRHKNEVVQFELDLEENLWQLHYELKYGKYRNSGYRMFKIYDPKERVIQAISYKDRIVQRSLCDNFLIPLLEKRLIYDNCACRKGKGTSFAIKRMRQFMSMFYAKHETKGYFVKLDVTKYFDSIHHDKLKELFLKLPMDRDVLRLLFGIIDSYQPSRNVGLPMGNQSSQMFALYYLDSVDRYFKERMRIKYYVRYMDDVIVIVNDKKTAKAVLETAKRLLEEKSLTLNPKSQIIPLSRGIVFLGWKFGYGKNGKLTQTISRAAKKRIIKKADHSRLSSQEFIKRYRGFFESGNCFIFQNYLVSRIARKRKKESLSSHFVQ